MDFPEFAEKFQNNLLADKPSEQIIKWHQEGLIRKYLLPLDKCVGLQQDPKYHQDDVFTHCVKTCDNTDSDLVLRWSGLIHDLGKYDTQNYHIVCSRFLPKKRVLNHCDLTNKKCNKNCEYAIERITFYRHEITSERIARKVMKRYKVPLHIGKKVINLVSMHMYYYSSEWSEKALEKFIKNSGLKLEDLADWENFPLFHLRIADRVSRDLIPITDKQIDFINRLKLYFNHQSNP